MPMTVQGAEELRAKFRALPNELRYEVLEQAAREGAEVIAADARLRAPVLAEADPRRTPGALRNAIRVETITVNQDGVKVGIGPGPEAWWARFVEYGHFVGLKKSERKKAKITRAQGRRRQEVSFLFGDSSKFVAARPFLRPAALQMAKQAAGIIRERLLTAIDRVITRGS